MVLKHYVVMLTLAAACLGIVNMMIQWLSTMAATVVRGDSRPLLVCLYNTCGHRHVSRHVTLASGSVHAL